MQWLLAQDDTMAGEAVQDMQDVLRAAPLRPVVRRAQAGAVRPPPPAPEAA